MGTIENNYKTEDSSAYLAQEVIFGGKAVIYTTPASNGIYQFRCWIAEEKKYFRKTLRTRSQTEAIRLGEEEMLGVLTKIKSGHKIFGLSWGELCEEFLEHSMDRVRTGRITIGRYRTIKTQTNKHIIPFLHKNLRVSEIDLNSFMDYGMYRRKKNAEVQDVTIRNEYTTVNAIIRWGFRKRYFPFEKCNVEEIIISEPNTREAFNRDEYEILYRSARYWYKKADTEEEAYYRRLLKDFILIKTNSMCRFGEMRQLKWSMVKIIKRGDKKFMQINLPKEICKNRKSRTVVARNGHYFERIKTYSNFIEKDDYVFTRKEINKLISKSQYYRYWHKLMEYSGLNKLEKKLSYYSLRHFGITARLYSGVNYYDVSKVAGTNVSNIEKHYEHMDMTKMLDTASMTHSFDKDGLVERWVDK
jgi:integrase